MPKLLYMPLDEWKVKALKDEAPDDAVLTKSVLDTDIKVMASERRIRITLSTKSVDRDNDTIDPEGWDTRNYEKNPVVLWAHDYRGMPIGTAVELSRTGEKLSAVDQFVERDVYPFADTVFQMLKGGYLNASSVGFRPIKRAFDEDRRGFDFITQELLEHSIVPVPANPEALIEARSTLGPDIMQPMMEWCEMVLDEWHGEKGLWMPRSKIEAAWDALNEKTVVDMGAAKTETEETKENPLAALSEQQQATLLKLLEKYTLDEDGNLTECVEGEVVEQSLDEFIASIVGDNNNNSDSLLADVDAEVLAELTARALSETLEDTVKRSLTSITGRLYD